MDIIGTVDTIDTKFNSVQAKHQNQLKRKKHYFFVDSVCKCDYNEERMVRFQLRLQEYVRTSAVFRRLEGKVKVQEDE